jgi:acyl dehydratase
MEYELPRVEIYGFALAEEGLSYEPLVSFIDRLSYYSLEIYAAGVGTFLNPRSEMTELVSTSDVKEQPKVAVPDSDKGRITDEDVARLRARIGIPVPPKSANYNPVADRTSIEHFAFGNGEDNPLFREPEYGRSTRWRGQIAPPTYLISAGVNETEPIMDPETKKLFRGVFRGVGKYFRNVSWTWYRPVYAGDEIYEEEILLDVTESESSFGGGSRSVIETLRWMYVDRTGAPFATRDEAYANIERGASNKAGKFNGVTRASYTPAEIAEIDAAYEAEALRGAAPRWWEDVEVGESIGTVVKGPTTVTDIISNQMARGWGGYGPGPLRGIFVRRSRASMFRTNMACRISFSVCIGIRHVQKPWGFLRLTTTGR